MKSHPIGRNIRLIIHSALYLILIELLLCYYVHSAPYLMLSSGAARCFNVDVHPETKIDILYNAPDLTVNTPDAQGKVPNAAQQVREEEGLDKRYNERRRKMEEELALLARKTNDMSILIMQRDPDGGPSSRKKRSGSGRIVEQIQKTEGKIEYTTGDWDGLTEICAQSYSAQPKNPKRISFRVLERSSFDDSYASEIAAERKEEEVRKLSMHSSRISAELDSFHKRMEELSKNSNYAKEREQEFHGKSVSLNKAVKYWPIFRICILIIAGYFQVSRVVSFMKSKHIF